MDTLIMGFAVFVALASILAAVILEIRASRHKSDIEKWAESIEKDAYDRNEITL